MFWHGKWTTMVCTVPGWISSGSNPGPWCLPQSVKLKQTIEYSVKVAQLYLVLLHIFQRISRYVCALSTLRTQHCTACIWEGAGEIFRFADDGIWMKLPADLLFKFDKNDVQQIDLLQQLGRCKHQNNDALTTWEFKTFDCPMIASRRFMIYDGLCLLCR